MPLATLSNRSAPARAAWLLAGCLAGAAALAGRAPAAEAPATPPPARAAEAPDRPAAPLDPARIEALIAELGDADFVIRERAQAELALLGADAFEALAQAEQSDDIEIAARAHYLVRLIHVEWTTEADTPEVRAAMADFDLLDEAGSRAKLAALVELPNDEGLAAVARVVRFAKSAALSKLAALTILNRESPPGGVPSDVAARRAATLAKTLGDSGRPAAEWLRLWADTRQAPEARADRWGQLAEVETRTLSQTPELTRAEVCVGLWRQRARLLKQLERRDEALATIYRMIELEREASPSLAELLDGLLADEDWKAIDAVATRYADRFQHDPLLLYILAQARKAQGDAAAAEAAVDRALSLDEGQQYEHIMTALKLRDRSLYDWAEGEFRLGIAIGPPQHPNTLQAQFILAEMLHDLQRDGAAAEVLAAASETLEQLLQGGRQPNVGRNTTNNEARRLFFLACHAAAENRPDEQRQLLEQGLREDPLEVDILISLYRLSADDAALRTRIERAVRETADLFRQRIQQEPEDESSYNQLAWLISNTEGDVQEALRCSRRSLEIRPNYPGYLDTLARCHFAAGELAEAVALQERAVALEPSSQQMQRQLAEFRAARERQTRGGDRSP